MIWAWLLGLLLLTKPDGGPIWIVDNQVVAVFEAPNVGASSTVVVTLNGAFYVKESPQDVARKLGWQS